MQVLEMEGGVVVSPVLSGVGGGGEEGRDGDGGRDFWVKSLMEVAGYGG